MDDLLLQKYLRNETSEEELVEVLDWLDASTENQRYLDRLDYISNLNILAGEAQPRVSRRTVSLWKRTAQWSAAAAAALGLEPVEIRADYTEYKISSDASAEAFLRRLLESGVYPTRYEIKEPSLHEIFLDRVGGTEEDAKR